jgi:Pectinacetylesterase
MAAAIATAACSSGGDEAAGPETAAPVAIVAPETAAPGTVAVGDPPVAETPAPVPEETIAVDPVAWEKVAGGEDCMCAGGTDWNMWVRDANPEKVVLYFQGGGACFSGEMCDLTTSNSYDRTVTADDDPTNANGIFDFSNAANPLTDWSFVFVPYCTGDIHIGDKTNDYGNGVVIEHKGMVNSKFALAELQRRFPNANDILVTGSSAGGVPAPLFAGLAGDLYPDAQITALADGSGAYPSDPGINAAIGSFWGIFDARPQWPETATLTAGDWGVPDLFIYAGKHNPNIMMARHDHSFDEVQVQFSSFAGFDASSIDQLIAQNAAKIESGGVPVATYVAPGTDHTILGRKELYTQVVEGVPMIDWLADLVNHQPVDDVQCTTCK